MRLSELSGKEVINLGDGARLGVIDDCELTIEAGTGRIQALVLPGRGGLLSVFGDNRASTIPWRSIKRIGDDVIIVDLNNTFDGLYNNKGYDGVQDTY
ncbi:hypothetical protein SDC9_06173 [bioreactor metagenome]|uniref:PRC-barrel domain-containing protein n=1 Tax=bioreactor metagenome TaxID=1076179 RepID=A0A644T318_9ZZZZ|nr:YlmC/YmxH family sporulation protein [Negativicutes bacterium]